MNRPGRSYNADRRHGLTLLEVMLALAILGGALAVIGELMRLAARNAEAARDLTTAQLFCETKVNEIVAGLLPAQAVSEVPIEDFETVDDQGRWLYSVTVDQIDQQGLISLSVTVYQNADLVPRPVSFTLVRWMIDPTMTAQQTGDAAAGASSSSTTGASGGF